jgi:hypothetical protein
MMQIHSTEHLTCIQLTESESESESDESESESDQSVCDSDKSASTLLFATAPELDLATALEEE